MSQQNRPGMPQCRVCMDEFQASGPKKSKVLPCQHTFCRECLRSMESDGRIECPLCREICQKAIEELPNNFLRLQLNGLRGTQSSNTCEPTSPTPGVDDMILALWTCYKEPDKVLSQLKEFRHVQKTTQFQAEHIMMVMSCMEHYAQHPLQQPDIIITCIQIVHDMVSRGVPSCMSVAVQEKLHDDIFDVLTVSNIIRTALRSPCIDILFALCISNNDMQTYCTCANAKVLFEFMHESLQLQEDAKLAFVLERFLRTTDVAAKEDIGTRKNVKIVLEKISSNPYMDSLDTLIDVLVDLTNMAALPCQNIVAEGGLNIIKSLLEEQSHRNDVLSSATILLSNISEIPDLRKDVIKTTSLVDVLVILLHSEVSFLSASTIANLSFVPASEWLELCGTDEIRTAALAMLHDLALLWITEDPFPGLMPFGLSSFEPYFTILQLYSAPPCQLYAAWLIRKCCTDDKERYHDILIKEEGISILCNIKENDSADEILRGVIGDILSSIS